MDAIFAYALVCSLAWAIVTISHRHNMSNVHIVTAFSVVAIISFSVFILVLPFYHRTILNDFKHNSKSIIMHGTIFMTFYLVLGQLLYYYVLHNASNINYIMPILYTTPLFALMLGYYVLKERVTPGGIVGCLFIVIGAAIIAITNPKGT
jgi:drug/metabolite transporter (DMT)-like permease